MIDIDKFLEKEIKKKKEQELKLDFLADVELTLNKIKEKVSSSPIEKINNYYKEIFGFEKELKGKFLSIENTTYQVLNTLVYDFYEKKYIEDVKQFKKKKQEFEIKLKNIEDNLEKKEIKKALESYTEAINILNRYPNGFFEEKFKDLRELGTLYKRLSEYIKVDIEKTKKEILKKFKEYLYNIVESLKEKDYLKLEKEIINLEKLITEIPKSLSSDFLPYEEKSNQLLLISKDILFKYHRDRFEYLEGEIKEDITRFKEYTKKNNLKDTFLIYNVILNLFKRLPDFFLEKKKELFENIVDLYSELNNLILKENVTFFSNQERIGFLLSNFEEYYYLININPKYYSTEKVEKIIKTLKKINSEYSVLLLKKFELFLNEKEKKVTSEKEVNQEIKIKGRKIGIKKEEIDKEERERKREEELKKKEIILKIISVKKLLQKLDNMNNIEDFKKQAIILKDRIIKLDINNRIKDRLLEELEKKIENKKRKIEMLKKIELKEEVEEFKKEILKLKNNEKDNITETEMNIKRLVTKIKISKIDEKIKDKLLKIIQEIYLEKAMRLIVKNNPDIKKIILLYEKLFEERDKNKKKLYIKGISVIYSKLNLTPSEKKLLKKYLFNLKNTYLKNMK